MSRRWKSCASDRALRISLTFCGATLESSCSRVRRIDNGANPMDLGLTDCKAFVAGASKGLGKACAAALAGEGARVFICSRNATELKQAAAEIGAAGYSAADVSQPAEVKRVVAEAIAALGGLDCLVTNAGGPPTAPFERAGDGDWDIAYQLNLMSAVRLIREALPALKASGRGRIVNLTGYGVKEPMTDLVVSDSVRAGGTG